MKADRLSRFEDQIQRLVEGGFARLFAGRLYPREVAIQLARAMEDHCREAPSGDLVAPDVYIVRLNPEDHQAIVGSEANIAGTLANELVEMARLVGATLVHMPEVRLLADPALSPHEVAISARHSTSQRETTQAMPLARLDDAGLQAAPMAMLIVNGNHIIPLEAPIINLGRHRDNDIILDDPRVSRHHAQIRLRFGRFVLFDLGSTGGTTINGQPVQEHELQPGDVISLAGNTLIYVEEIAEEARPDEASPDTQPYSPEQD